MKKIFIIIIFATTAIISNAQNEIDALRYSTQNHLGTARHAAMAGAFGSLGGEFSALSSNPAGIGMYQISEFTFTPSLSLNTNKSYYNQNNLLAYKSQFSVENIGIVFSVPKNKSDWRRVNFGLGWNKLAEYNSNINIEGINNSNSIVDKIIDLTNGTLTGELTNGNGNAYSQMAWNTYLIDPVFDSNNNLIDGEYSSNFSLNPKHQQKKIRSSGSLNEFILSIGGSYKEKLYIGATIGIPTLDYYEYSEYSEEELSDTSNNLRRMVLNEEISTYGTGYNLKIGAIYRLADNIKIGGSIHTPTYFSIEEDYNTSLMTFFKDSILDYSMGYFNPFKFNLITPLKASLSASTIINKNIIVSAEYEVIDYSKNEYFTNGFEEENEIIKNIYQNTENIKLGAEITFNPFVFRAGYANFGSSLKDTDFSRENFSYGMGLNYGSYFFDIAYVLSQEENQHQLYSDDLIDPIKIISTNHNILFTLGFRY